MMKEVARRRTEYLNALVGYEKTGMRFKNINPDIVDGMLIKICDRYGWDNLKEFFRYFHDSGPIQDDFIGRATDEEQRTSIIIGALSASMKADLSQQFQQWNFPIDKKLHDATFNMLVK